VQTELDGEIVSWIGRVGGAGAEHVMARFGMGRSWAYRRLSRLVRDRLLEHVMLLHRVPGLYVASREGLRWRGLERLGFFRVSPGGFAHASEVARVAAIVEPGLPCWRVLSDRELRVIEADDGRETGSVKVGELPGGGALLHRPDLALVSPTGKAIAVEVELSVKARRRLQAICRGYARARHLDRVYYLATPAAGRAVERAVADVRAQDRITVLALDDVEPLLTAVRGPDVAV
jgi:hypothetical protein